MKIIGILPILMAVLWMLHYWHSRWEARSAFAELAGQAPARFLSEAEHAALAPFRTCFELGRETEVRILEGPCLEHRVWMHRSSRAWRSIGLVKVLLPFDARDHVGAVNRAEVVLAGDFAVVLRVGGFDIATAGPQALRTAATQVSERYETHQERRQRRRPTSPWAAAGLALAAGACGVLVQLDLGRWSWIVPMTGLVLAISAFLLYRRRQVGPDAPQAVLRVRGRLNTLDVEDPHDCAYTHHLMLLGNDQRLVIDPQWLQSDAICPGQWLEAEVRTLDRQLLSLGPHWSLLADEQRFPPVAVARHMLMFTVAVVSLLLVFLSGDTPRIEAERATALFGPAVLRTAALPAELRDHLPAPGDGLHLTVDATCELVAREHAGMTMAMPDCNRLRWGGTRLDVPPLAVADSILRLGSGNVLHVHWDPADGVLPAFKRVYGLDALRKDVDDACADGLGSCNDLRAHLALLPPGDAAVLSRRVFNDLEAALGKATSAHVLASWAGSTPGLLAAQRGGVVLVDAHPRPWLDASAGLSGNAGQDWKKMRDAATQPERIAWSGTLQSRSSDGQTLWLEVDRERAANAAIAGLVYCIWLGGASLLALLQGFLLVRAVLRLGARLHAFSEELRQRPAPAASWPA